MNILACFSRCTAAGGPSYPGDVEEAPRNVSVTGAVRNVDLEGKA